MSAVPAGVAADMPVVTLAPTLPLIGEATPEKRAELLAITGLALALFVA